MALASIVGFWRLVRAVARDADGKQLPVPYGGQGMGHVMFSTNGRMMAVVCDGRQALPPGIEREYSSYCGNYTFDGLRLVTRVDAASDPGRIGSDQVREVRFEGGLMVLRPPVRAYGGSVAQRELYWEKVAEI
jgi:hypothetical protein